MKLRGSKLGHTRSIGFRFLAVLALAVGLASPSRAALHVDITRGNIQPMTIAVPAFLAAGAEKQLGADIAAVVEADLKRSGLFAPLDKAAFIQQIAAGDQAPRFADWRVINAQALAVGTVAKQPDGRLKAEFRLWDIFAGQQLAGQQFFTSPDNWRRVAHIIADAIYEKLTGEKGYFDSRVVFVEETSTKDRRVKRLAIMDQDGANLRYLTNGSDLVLTPRFSPNTQEITYMSYAGGQPKVYLMNVETGQKELVGDFPGMTFSPRFSPNGQTVVMSLQQDGNANIYTMDLRTRKTTRLTSGAAIDTGPTFSPDGKQIAFESDRGGSQQIYVMNADGSNQRRISFGEGSHSTPVWSPRGDLIAFTKRSQDKFGIGVVKPDGSGERVLTTGFHNEGPTWSPNGRVIMFFRDTPGANGGPQLWTIDLTGYNETRVQTPAFASDPAWSSLIN